MDVTTTNTSLGAGGSSKIYIWGVQLEKYSVTDLVKTTGTAGSEARYSHDPETLTPTGLYLEPATTNYWHDSNLNINQTAPYTSNITAGYNYNNTITPNAAIAPDGTQTAALVVPRNDVGANKSHWFQQPHYQTTAGSTFSCFVKYNGWRYVAIRNGHGGGANQGGIALFDLVNGTYVGTNSGVSHVHNPIIEAYPNGWYRISNTRLTAGTGWASLVFYENDNLPTNPPMNPSHSVAPDGVSGIYIWGIQWERNPYPTSVIISNGNDTTRAADVYTSTANLTETFEPRGLLIEEARTNDIRKSIDFSGSDYVKSDFSAEGSTTTAPDGSTIPWYNLPSFIYQDRNVNTSSGTVLTTSIWLKAETECEIGLRNPAGNVLPNDIVYGSGSSNSSNTSAKLKVTTKWQRFSVTGTRDGNSPTFNRFLLDNRLNLTANTVKIAIWNVQMEVGSFPTSDIINTTTSSLTRSADIVSISGDNFGTYRTNLTTYSNLQTGNTINGTGGFYYLDYIPYYGLSPSAKYDSTKIIPNGTNNSITRLGIQGYAPPGTNRKTISFYAKA